MLYVCNLVPESPECPLGEVGLLDAELAALEEPELGCLRPVREGGESSSGSSVVTLAIVFAVVV